MLIFAGLVCLISLGESVLVFENDSEAGGELKYCCKQLFKCFYYGDHCFVWFLVGSHRSKNSCWDACSALLSSFFT